MSQGAPAADVETSTAGRRLSLVTPLDRPKSVELFAGAGGLALGCQLAGFDSVATLERDRWACDTVRENKARGHHLVTDWNVYEGDIRTFDWSVVTDEVDLVGWGTSVPAVLRGRSWTRGRRPA